MTLQEERERRRAHHRARVRARRSPQALPALVVLAVLALAGGATVVASLALAQIVVGWGVFLFYALPAAFFLGWAVREFDHSLWRRAVFPFVWLWTCATGRRAPRPPAGRTGEEEEAEEERREEAHVLARGGGILGSERAAELEERTIEPWLRLMRVFLSAWRTPRIRRWLNAGFGAATLALTGLAARHFSEVGWPLERADVRLVVAAGALMICTFALKAFGWQRLFRAHERPTSVALAAATGVAALAGVALPGRFDDALRVSVVRGFPRVHVGVGTIALSLFLLGLLDTAALAPFAAAAAASPRTHGAIRIAFAVVAAAGVGAAALAAALPRISASARLGRFRIARWLSKHAPASSRDALEAALLVLGAWIARTVGLVILLAAFGFGISFPLAAAYLAAGAASAALPISPAGAATQAGVGAAVLAAYGIGPTEAIAFSVAAQLLTILAGTLVAAFALALQGAQRRFT